MGGRVVRTDQFAGTLELVVVAAQKRAFVVT